MVLRETTLCMQEFGIAVSGATVASTQRSRPRLEFGRAETWFEDATMVASCGSTLDPALANFDTHRTHATLRQ